MTEPTTPPPAGWRAFARDPFFREGARDMTGLALGIGAWGLVTGVAMAKSGMGLVAAVLMSLTVFAGSAQLATAPLMASGAPIWVVWATALCLNLRFIVFSAQMRPYFAHLPLAQRVRLSYFCADLNFVLFARRWPQARPQPGQHAYFWGGACLNTAAWHVMSLIGIALGHRIPDAWGLGFAGTVALLAMTVSMLGERATWLPALLAGCAAVAAYALPLKLHMLVAIAAAVAAGTLVDKARPSHRETAR